MSLPVIIAILASNFFGITAIILSLRENKARKQLLAYEDEQRFQTKEGKLMRDINNHIDYYLNIDKIVQVIGENLNDLIKYSAISTLVVNDQTMSLRTHAVEAVNSHYIDEVKTKMLDSLQHLTDRDIKELHLDEKSDGKIIEEVAHATLASYFHLPFIVDDKTLAIITISSTRPNLYTEKEMNALYSIINRSAKSFNRLQSALNIEKSKLSAMVESLADGLFMVDAQSNVSNINPAARNFLQITKESPALIEVLSSLPIQFDFKGKIQKAIMSQESSEIKDLTIHNKVFNISITPVINIHDKTGKDTIGASVLMHDVTLRKAVAQMKEDFTNIIVHELRSPLTSIKAGSQLLLSDTKLSEEERKKLMVVIHEQSNKMLDEVALILDAAKIEAGLFTIQKAPADLKQLITDRLTVFLPMAQEKMIKLTSEVDPLLPKFSFDSHHIGQVINNLISNSMKFTPNGGSIKIVAKTMQNKIFISVTDSGKGIPKDKQPMLFNRFAQIAPAGTNTGTGLGLYLVKGVVEAHGGVITLESDEEHGTTISFTLPVEHTPNTMSQGNSEPTEQRPSRMVN
jgi:signal transduction histidine kinase